MNQNSVHNSVVCNSGVEHVSGDMFESVPQGDALMLKVSIFVHTIKFLYNSIVYLVIVYVMGCSQCLIAGEMSTA